MKKDNKEETFELIVVDFCRKVELGRDTFDVEVEEEVLQDYLDKVWGVDEDIARSVK